MSTFPSLSTLTVLFLIFVGPLAKAAPACVSVHSGVIVNPSGDRVIKKLLRDVEPLGREISSNLMSALSSIQPFSGKLKAAYQLLSLETERISRISLTKTTLTEDELSYILGHVKNGSEYIRKASPKDVERYFLNELKRFIQRVEFELARATVFELVSANKVPKKILSEDFAETLAAALMRYNDLSFAYKSEIPVALKNYKTF